MTLWRNAIPGARRTRSRAPLFAVAVGAALTAACTMPAPFAPTDPTTPRTAPRASSISAANQAGGSGPIQRLMVNGEPLTARVVIAPHLTELRKQSQLMEPEAYQRQVHAVAVGEVIRAVSGALLYQHASQRMTEGERRFIEGIVDAELRKIITTGFEGVQRRYEQHLDEQGLTIDDARELMRRDLVIRRYIELQVKPQIAEPTRDELLTMFAATNGEWNRPPRYRMSLIDVRIAPERERRAPGSPSPASGSSGSPSQPDPESTNGEEAPAAIEDPSNHPLVPARGDALRRAQEADSAVRSGTPFPEVARRYSDGLHAADGGSWGWVSPDGVRERYLPVMRALEQLSPGEVSPIIETPDAFFIVRCDEVDPGETPDFQALQRRLKERYLQATYARHEEMLVHRLRDGARIEPPEIERFVEGVIELAPKPAP
jgi:parvulin-like peptidyl-prolyl isomerase